MCASFQMQIITAFSAKIAYRLTFLNKDMTNARDSTILLVFVPKREHALIRTHTYSVQYEKWVQNRKSDCLQTQQNANTCKTNS